MLDVKKTKLLDIDKSKQVLNSIIQNENIQNTNDFEYLGARIDHNNTAQQKSKENL